MRLDQKNTTSSTPTESAPHNTLARYFQEMSSTRLLDAKSEAALAATLRTREERTWQTLLEYAPAIESITNLLEDAEVAKVNFRSLRSTATKHRRAGTSKSQLSLSKAAAKAAVLLREHDPDRKLLAAVQERLKEELIADEYFVRIDGCLARATETRNRFVECNLGLVVSVARRYQFSGMGLADLIQEGNLGLLKAVCRFDDRRGFRFSTYATWWIRHSVGRAVSDKSRTVRVPVHVMEANQKISKVYKELSSELGRDPTREETAKALGLTVAKIENTQRSATGYSMSLDAPLGDDGDRKLLDVFATDEEDSAYDRLASHSLSKRANVALETLAPLEIEIIHRRFGLAGKTATTLQEIANTVGKSRERIRQIQEKALMKMRENLVAEQAV